MKLRCLTVVVLASLWLVGCSSNSLYPLYTKQDAVEEPALEGTWVSTEAGDSVEIKLQKSGDHSYSVSAIDPDTKMLVSYKLTPVRLGGQLFLDLEFDEQTLDGAQVHVPFGFFPTHMIIKAQIKDAELGYALLDSGVVRKSGPPKSAVPLSYQVVDPGLFETILITAETEDLRRFVSAHADDGFTQFDHLRRVVKAAN